MSTPLGKKGASSNVDKSEQGEGGGPAESENPFQFGLC